MSYYTSLSGLRGAQADLSAISNNVANVGTYGFKRSRVEFGDIMPPSPLSAGLGVRVRGVNQQFTQGGVEASTRDLDIAINGAGFFMSRSAADDGRTVFTRDGSLGFNADRYLTDSNNGFVQVLPVDSSGRVTSTNISSAQSLQLPETSGVPRPTTVLEMTTTLPRTTDKPAERSHYSASNPYAFNRADPFSYNFTQSTTVYDDAGTALPATLYFTAVESTLDGDSADRWEVHAFVGDTDALATPMSMTFNPAGALISPSGAFSLDTVLPTGATAPLNMDVVFGSGTKLTGGTFEVSNISQDGFAPADFNDFSIAPDGLLTATFSDGSTQLLGRLLIARFPNPEGLRQEGDARWRMTTTSGEATIGSPGSNGFNELQLGALEQSNIDLTEELVRLITAQRNFQANAKAIDTANAMTQAIINLRN